jgi:hypothetical protein
VLARRDRLIRRTRFPGARKLNAGPAPYDPPAAAVIREPIGTALPALLDGLDAL